MKSYCITLPKSKSRFDATNEHMAAHGINLIPFYGLDNRDAGIATEHVYEVDHPGSGYRIAGATIGIAISHWMIWRMISMLDDEMVAVYEDDVRVSAGGIERMKWCLDKLPDSWDILYTGSCCCSGKRHQNDGYLWQVWWPFCTHAYVIRRRAAKRMVEYHKRIWAPVDLSMVFDVYQLVGLGVYTTIPRAFEQHNTVIPE